MRIRLLVEVPVAKEHGLVKGKELNVNTTDYDIKSKNSSFPRWWVTGDTGEPVGILPREAEEIADV